MPIRNQHNFVSFPVVDFSIAVLPCRSSSCCWQARVMLSARFLAMGLLAAKVAVDAQ